MTPNPERPIRVRTICRCDESHSGVDGWGTRLAHASDCPIAIEAYQEFVRLNSSEAPRV